jgi:hypothetical protein
MSFQVDSNTVGAIVGALLGCVTLSGWLGWSLRGRRAARDQARFVEVLRPVEIGGALLYPCEAGELISPWWDAGYSRGYRDGKNNRRRRDKARDTRGGISGGTVVAPVVDPRVNWTNSPLRNPARSIAESIVRGVDPNREWHSIGDTQGDT